MNAYENALVASTTLPL